MTEASLKTLILWCQILAGGGSIIAAVSGIAAGWAGGMLSNRADEKLRVIGQEWKPLTLAEMMKLTANIVKIGRPGARVQVMYENRFGQELATTIKYSLEAAHWNVERFYKYASDDGIHTGSGPLGIAIKDAIERSTYLKGVISNRTSDPDIPLYYITIGPLID